MSEKSIFGENMPQTEVALRLEKMFINFEQFDMTVSQLEDVLQATSKSNFDTKKATLLSVLQCFKEAINQMQVECFVTATKYRDIHG